MQLEDGRYITVKKYLSLDHITAHLKGFITLGAYALDEESKAKWICLDADTDEQWQGLWSLARQFERQNITPYLEPSRRGGHLWLFIPPISGEDARCFGRQLLAMHDLQGIELYPKQDALKTGPGSLVRLPLGRHRLTGRRYHFVTPSGEPLAPTVREQIDLLAQPARVPQAFIDEVMLSTPASQTSSPIPPFAQTIGEAPGATLSERLKNSVSVHDFVSRYVELDRQGRGLCPFHDDRRKSFGVNVDGNYWHCWAGCGGGSLIDFWSRWRAKNGQDPGFVATITELADMLLPRSNPR